MSQNKIESMEKTHIRILYWGIILDIFLPLVIFFLAVYFRDRLIQVQAMKNLDLFFYVLLAVSLSEVGAIFIIKKKFSTHLRQKDVGHPPKADSLAQEGSEANAQLPLHQNFLSFAMVIFALCFSPTIYGLVYYILGGTWERFALFVAITFLLFQLFKPKTEEIEKLVRI